MKLTYQHYGEYYLPNIGIPAEEEHCSLVFNQLLLSGKRMNHLYSVDNICQKRFDLLFPHMKAVEGVTETLKAADQVE